MSKLSKVVYRLDAISLKIPRHFFSRNGNTHTKIYMESQGTINSQKKSWTRIKLKDPHFLISKLTTMRYHFMLISMLTKKKQQKSTRAGKNVEKWEPCVLLVRIWNGAVGTLPLRIMFAVGNSTKVPLKIKNNIKKLKIELSYNK